MNTISKRAVTRLEIQSSMEVDILKGCGADVRVTMMGRNLWSMFGSSREASKAIEYLEQSRIVKEIDLSPSSCGEFSIYFRTGA